MTRITTMLGMAAGAVIFMSFAAAPALAGSIQYLNGDCEAAGSGCPIVTEPRSVGDIRRANGLTLDQFRLGNPKLPEGIGDDYIVGKNSYVMYYPFRPDVEVADLEDSPYLMRLLERVQANN